VIFPNIHVLYTNLVHPLHYFTSHAIALFKVTLTDLMFHIHIFIESTSTIYSPSFTLFIYPCLLKSALPLTWILHGILPVNIWCLNKPNLLHYYSPSFLPLLCTVQQFSVFSCVLFLHRCDIFHNFSLHHSSFPPSLDSSNSFNFGNIFCIYLYVYMQIEKKMYQRCMCKT
jgi:hypothetical protein